MSILDASGNLLQLLGSACLYVKTQVLGRNTIKKLEVAVMKQGASEDREILLSLKTLVDWNLVHEDFPNIKLDDFIQKMINKHIGKKAYSTIYSKQNGQKLRSTTARMNILEYESVGKV